MTDVDSITRVRSDRRAGLVAECTACGVDLVLIPGHDVCAGLRALDQCHPGQPGGRHLRAVPEGWRVAARRPRGGALQP